MNNEFYIEVEAKLINHQNEKICGDVFLKKRIKEENRVIAILSDGLGHGVKANVLATLTATMAMNFAIEHKKAERIAEIIMKTLPVCSERQISYSTFTIVDIDANDLVHILEFDNPDTLIFRDNESLILNREEIELNNPQHKGKKLFYSTFYPKLNDRIIFFSDGVSQAGLGSDKFPFGWEGENVKKYVSEILKTEPQISALKLAEKITNKAILYDNYNSKDDTSCASVYFRNPRKLLLVTGPPIDKSYDKELAKIVEDYTGKKIVSGGSTANLLSRELNKKITDSLDFFDPELPPISYMEGIDLVTEGILTLNKVWKILTNYTSDYKPGKGPADKIVKLIIESDQIDIIVGTKINEAHQDPNVPVDLEIRRTIAARIANVLETKLLKNISVKHV
jgi:hypothetical protein